MQMLIDLSKPEARSQLPIAAQLVLYLDPSVFFKDATKGKPVEQAKALAYNQEHRGLLLRYIARWMFIATASMGAMLAIETIMKAWVYLTATFGIASCISVTVAMVFGATYLLLSRP